MIRPIAAGHQFALGEKVSWASFSALVCVIFCWRLWVHRRTDDHYFRLIMTGVALVAGGTALNQIYWIVRRTAVAVGAEETAHAMHTNPFLLLLSTTPILLVLIGYSFHIYAWASKPAVLGRSWWAWLMALFMVTWGCGFLLPKWFAL